MKLHCTIKRPSGQLNGNLTLIFMIPCKYDKKKKKNICGNISFVIGLWAGIFIAYITLNPASTFPRQLYPGEPANFLGSSIIFFFIAPLIIRCFGQIVASPRRSWLLLLLR